MIAREAFETADEIVALVRAGFADANDAYPMCRYEVSGGDAVGTDAYPALRDAWPRLVEALRAPSADLRIAAAYALAFVVEHAAETQPALDAAVRDAELPLERAAMILAAARLRSSIALWRSEPAYPWEPVPLSPAAARESHRAIRGALAIAQVFAMSPWGRKVQREVADALEALDGVNLGPWGAGNVGRLASALRETLFVGPSTSASVVYSAVPPEADDDPDAPHDDAPHDEVIDPAEQAAMDAVQAAIATAEAAIAAKSSAVQAGDAVQAASASAIYSAAQPEADDDPDATPDDAAHDDRDVPHDEAIDPAEQAAMDAVQAAIATAEAAIAAKSSAERSTDAVQTSADAIATKPVAERSTDAIQTSADAAIAAKPVAERSTDAAQATASTEASAAKPISEQDVADPYTQERPVRAAEPRVNLDGLHDVDWAGLEHAYGDARGVPGMLEALSSPDAGDRAWARDALFASINHQGSVYSASAPAVPFLVALVEHDELEDRASILALLAGLAVGDPRWWLFADLDEAASEAFEAVSAYGSRLVRFVADPDPEIRAHAALVLSFITPADGANSAVKRALAMEMNRYARASLLLALGYLGRRMKTTSDRAAIERYLDDDCMLIAACAAIALAQIDREACSVRAKAVLARTITEAPPVVGAWPWNGGNVAGFVRTVRLGILTDDEMLDEADAARARGDWQSGRDYASTVLVRLFRDGVHGVTRLWLPSELDDRRRRALRFLVDIAPTHAGAVAPQFPMDVLTAHSCGITTSVAASKRLLGEESGPLDREVECASMRGAAPVPAWFAIDEVVGERASLGELRSAFAAIAPAVRVEMAEDALSGPFALWHCRAPRDYANDAQYQRDQDHTSRFITAIAALLGDTGLVGVALAQTKARDELAKDRPSSINCLVAAIVLASAANADGTEPPEIIDRLVLTDQAPAGTYRIAIRAVLDLLSPERRRRLLGDLPLYSYWAHRDPRGEVRRWYNERGWDLVDLCESAACIAKIEGAWREWLRHRAAGDDPHAEPVRGSSTHSLEHKPGADQPFPIDRAIAILDACGEAARALRDELGQVQRSTSAPTMSTIL